jgi:hypothetical protein
MYEKKNRKQQQNALIEEYNRKSNNMENVRQVIVPIVAKCIHENTFYLCVSFLSLFRIKIVSQKMVILSGLSQKLVTGFFPIISFMTDAKFLLPYLRYNNNYSLKRFYSTIPRIEANNVKPIYI